ncbi:DUF350 domain-containing protein [Pelagicoccus sp. NFK12]|jgi:hypothetical protein|uniref:DUF350 domain-containing protein n=2 Tax=Pelagicoccus enzymogenes TaxID=2773457 RepID=A0A927F7J8_9BACT|nr:DUF350 domain-containing protein [Pelagicoccus enzymogenes]MBD5778398.1 DUF350 domain-containing protein [Pelagicoccus enzymogenes]
MDMQFLLASFANLLLSVTYTIISLFCGVYAIKMIDRFLLKKIDIEEELGKNNISVAIFAASLLLFVAIIISFGLRA